MENAVTSVVVVGAGAMGAGIAQVAATAGHRVTVIDQSSGALERGRQVIGAALAGRRTRGAMTQAEVDAILARLDFTTDMTAASGAALAIEAVVERTDAKLEVFAALARVLSPDAILASNTSSLSIAALAEGVPGPHRFIGLHFFNPAPVMQLVEIVPGPSGHGEITERMAALMRRWGKRPVVVRDVPGFIVNRVARPYYAEGFRALGEGVEAVAIDHALTASGGFRMGPLALADMIGHDVNYAVARSIFEAYGGRTRFIPEPAQQALFEAGRLGRKTGVGVYDHSAPPPLPDLRRSGPRPERLIVASRPGGFAPIVALARSDGIAVFEDARLENETLMLDDALVAFGDGRRLRDRADVGILVDPPRDASAWPTWVGTAAAPELEAAFAGLAEAVDRATLFVPDRPGQIVLRTLAQLANAAADAVQDGVASAPAVDEAMVFGANHPQGPLAWAAAFGSDRVARTLNHIADATGEAFYRPSGGLARIERALAEVSA